MEYTKGEWKAGQKTFDGEHSVCAEGYGIIAVFPGMKDEEQEIIANTHLVAAAPNMYKVLRAWQDWSEGKNSKTLTTIHEMRMDALAKAEGRDA